AVGGEGAVAAARQLLPHYQQQFLYHPKKYVHLCSLHSVKCAIIALVKCMVLLGLPTLDGRGQTLEEAHKQTGNTTRKLLIIMFCCCVVSGRSIRNFQRIYLLNRGEEIETVTGVTRLPSTQRPAYKRAALY